MIGIKHYFIGCINKYRLDNCCYYLHHWTKRSFFSFRCSTHMPRYQTLPTTTTQKNQRLQCKIIMCPIGKWFDAKGASVPPMRPSCIIILMRWLKIMWLPSITWNWCDKCRSLFTIHSDGMMHLERENQWHSSTHSIWPNASITCNKVFSHQNNNILNEVKKLSVCCQFNMFCFGRKFDGWILSTICFMRNGNNNINWIFANANNFEPCQLYETSASATEWVFLFRKFLAFGKQKLKKYYRETITKTLICKWLCAMLSHCSNLISLFPLNSFRNREKMNFISK